MASTSPGATVVSLAVGDELAGYRLLAELGEPGPTVRRFVADPPARLAIREPVVLKVLDGGSNRAFHRFTRELGLLATLGTSHVVALYEAGQEPELFWVSMERCPFGSLADALRPGGPARAARIGAVADAARAVHALHEVGVAHRDIRPGTVLLSAAGGKLGDLGVARELDTEGSVMASLSHLDFVDPALVRGGPAGRSTDIYSLGAVLHWAMTGRSLFPQLPDHRGMLAVRAVLRDGPLVDESLSSAEGATVRALLTPDPGERPADAAAAAALIERLLTTEPTVPEPDEEPS